MVQEYAWDKSAPGGIGGLLVTKEKNEVYSYVYSHQGHVQKVLNASGQVVESYQYTPYGQVEGGDFSQQPFGYSTKRSDFESGLVYFGYRFYSPYQRRWLNRDPLQEQGGINLYGYVNGDPLGYVDPDGRHPVVVGIAIAAARYVGRTILKKALHKARNQLRNALKRKNKSKSSCVPKGLKGNKDFKAAISQFKNTPFTNAGRAVTKHPEYFGFKNTNELRKVYNSEVKINKLAADTLKNIMRTGKTTTGSGGRYPDGWKTVTAPDGRAASWHADGRFIGFRGVQ